MKVLNLGCCSEFYSSIKAAEKPLRAWVTVARCAEWRSFADAKRTFGSVDLVGRTHVFNVGGNKYRLLAKVNYAFGTIKIDQVLTHSDYDKLDVRRL